MFEIVKDVIVFGLMYIGILIGFNLFCFLFFELPTFLADNYVPRKGQHDQQEVLNDVKS